MSLAPWQYDVVKCSDELCIRCLIPVFMQHTYSQSDRFCEGCGRFGDDLEYVDRKEFEANLDLYDPCGYCHDIE